ncbi:MAG: hypothetical protein ACKO2F_10305 [Cyanobacteriota bacterium]
MASSELLLLLQGGLGNQLFQGVLARTLAERHGRRLVVDPVLLTSRLRGLRGVTPRSLSPLLASQLPVAATPWHHRLPSRLGARWPGGGMPWTLTDARLSRASAAEDLPGQLGRTAVLRTHATHPALYRRCFDPAWLALSAALDAAGPAKPPPTVALHVRRGDYLQTSSGFFPLEPGYYRRALEMVRHQPRLAARAGLMDLGEAKAGPPLLHVFTDDPTWCHTHLGQAGWDLRIEGGSPEQDLTRLATARLLIISNSSFSAAAAHLARLRDPAAIVLCPNRWLLKEDGRLGDLRCHGWLTVEA